MFHNGPAVVIVDSGSYNVDRKPQNILYGIRSCQADTYEQFSENILLQNDSVDRIVSEESSHRKMLMCDFAVEYSLGEFTIIKNRFSGVGGTIKPIDESW
jgi:hypothetical protein